MGHTYDIYEHVWTYMTFYMCQYMTLYAIYEHVWIVYVTYMSHIGLFRMGYMGEPWCKYRSHRLYGSTMSHVWVKYGSVIDYIHRSYGSCTGQSWVMYESYWSYVG